MEVHFQLLHSMVRPSKRFCNVPEVTMPAFFSLSRVITPPPCQQNTLIHSRINHTQNRRTRTCLQRKPDPRSAGIRKKKIKILLLGKPPCSSGWGAETRPQPGGKLRTAPAPQAAAAIARKRSEPGRCRRPVRGFCPPSATRPRGADGREAAGTRRARPGAWRPLPAAGPSPPCPGEARRAARPHSPRW